MSHSIELVGLRRTPEDVRRFLEVPYGIYRGDPHWVAPLLFDLRKVFLDHNPFFEHAEMEMWVAARGGVDIGRIAGIVDRNYNRYQQTDAAFFGFLDVVDDPAASRLLFSAVETWARQKGVRRLVGPMNPSANDECGLLVEGFGSSPVFMMTYNPPYYVGLVEAEGFVKAKDLLAYYIDLARSLLDRLQRIAEKARRRNPGLAFRAVKPRTLRDDLAKIKEVYNEAWEDNWGFVPMTDPEIDFMAERLKPLLVEGLVWLVESAQEPVGFLLATPDFNQAIKPLGGHLLTPRLLGFLPYVFKWKIPPLARVIILGVKAKYRGRGLESVMLSEGLQTGFRIGFTAAEASWVLEDNVRMRRVIELFGAHVYKRYRLYQKDL